MSDHRFTNLRKRLDQLGYRQPLVIEAVPLVEKLFTDLIHTTESFKKYKSKTHNIDRAVSYADVNETYRVDNARLVKENNELHLQLIQCNEEIEKLQADMKSAVRKLEHENQDLRFLNSQYIHKVQNLEKESKLKSDQLETLQEHNLKAIVETPGGRRKNIPFRRQRMDMESTLEPSQSSVSDSISSQPAVDPYMADLLAIADKRVEEMKLKVEEYANGNDKLEKKNKSLQKKVELRDKEVTRLNDMLSGGRPVEAVLSDHKRSSGDKVVTHLNIQVDYLQQANRDLEKQVKHNEEARVEAESTIKSLEERNDELCLEISRLDKLYHTLDKQKRSSDQEVDGQINTLKNEMEGKHQKLIDLQASNYNMKKERDELIEETERLNFLVVSAKEDKRNLADLYERCDKDRRKLQEKNARLTVTERELVMDLERLKLSKGILPKKTKSPDRTENLVRNLEEDRDYYKKECDSLLEVVHKKVLGKVTNNIEEMGSNSGVAQILKEERDYYKKEYEMLRSKAKELHSPPTSDKVPSSENETARLRRERDKLQKLLGTFEKHLTQIQENVSAVTTEKDNVQLLYEQASEEVQRLRRQISRGVPPGKESLKITSILEKAEKERDLALEELRKARIDIQSLRDDVKNARKQQKEVNRNSSTREQELNEIISKLEVEKGTLDLKISESDKLNQSLQDKLDAANDALFSAKEDLSEKESEIAKMRLLLEQGDDAQNELRKRIQGTVADVEQKNLEKKAADEELESRQKAIESLENEVGKLKNTVITLDRERDTLHMQIDAKTEEHARLSNDLEEQQNLETDLRAKIEELEKEMRNRDQDILSKQKEISSLTKQVRSMESEIDGLFHSRDATTKENKRIQDDLAMMTEENQSVYKNLRESEDNVEAFKRQVEEYTLQIARIQDMISQKDLEKEELSLQYKELSSKADFLEKEIQVKETNADLIQQDLLNKEQILNQLHDRCASFEVEIEQHISTEESYESEISSLTKSLANIEAQLRICNEEKDHIIQDLYAVRELCVKLDQSREELTRNFSVTKLDNEKLERRLNECEAESEYLRAQVEQERDMVRSLEKVIASDREKEFYGKRKLQEEVEILEQKSEILSKTEQDRKVKNVENANLRLTNLTLQEDLTALRKQLTSEKFEKERLKQEMRRSTEATLKGLESTKDSGVVQSDGTTSGEKFIASPTSKYNKDSNVPPSYVRPNVTLNETYTDLNLSISDVDDTSTAPTSTT